VAYYLLGHPACLTFLVLSAFHHNTGKLFNLLLLSKSRPIQAYLQIKENIHITAFYWIRKKKHMIVRQPL